MDIKKIAPWNWFKDEEKSTGSHLPVVQPDWNPSMPIMELHQEIDRLFDKLWNRTGYSELAPGAGFMPSLDNAMLKPSVDIAASDKSYRVTVEVPGVDEDNLQLELVDDRLIIKGEKLREKQDKDRDYYRVERSYGVFQRVLTLPEDTENENIDARFENGILTVEIPRKSVSQRSGKLIDIKAAA